MTIFQQQLQHREKHWKNQQKQILQEEYFRQKYYD